MREIKFRAWDKKEKKMIFAGDKFRGQEEIEIGIELGGYPLELSYEPYYPSIIRLDDIELMQFTGLKDKNGKDVYEGDIVNYYFFDRPSDISSTEIIKWENIDHVSSRAIGFHFGGENVEVIGNIYENKDLLN